MKLTLGTWNFTSLVGEEDKANTWGWEILSGSPQCTTWALEPPGQGLDLMFQTGVALGKRRCGQTLISCSLTEQSGFYPSVSLPTGTYGHKLGSDWKNIYKGCKWVSEGWVGSPVEFGHSSRSCYSSISKGDSLFCSGIWLGCLLGEIFWVYPTGKRPWGRPKTY